MTETEEPMGGDALLDPANKPNRDGLEPHQLWVWMQGATPPRWEIRGTGDLPTCDPTQPDATSPWPHDYEEVGEEYGSLGEGGSYVVLRCRRCGRRAYRQLPD